MKSTKDSEELTRVGAGTVMGEFMRQYWIPAIKSNELQRDGAPMRLMLLGEKLIAFRDTLGRVGVMQHPARTAARRCSSAATKKTACAASTTAGSSTSTATASTCPACRRSQDFKDKVKAKAYTVAERNGLIWVYMGPRSEAPPLPMVEATLLPEDQVDIVFVQRDCNWMQALEGDIDTSHFGFLHVGHVDPSEVPPGHPLQHTAEERAPQYHVRDVPWGTSYARLPAGRARPGAADLLALRELHVPVLDPNAAGRVSAARACPRLGAARRRAHDVRVPALALGHEDVAGAAEERRAAVAAARAWPSTSRSPPTGSAAGGSRPTRATTG